MLGTRGVPPSDRRLFSALVRWTIRGAAGLLLLVCALSLIGAVFQHFAAETDSKRVRPNGRMIAVEGHQFHLHCKGQGIPTVILEPGSGLPSLVWAWVQAQVSDTSRVCIYDRAGYGWSEPIDVPMDAENVTRQLYALLKAGNIPVPYVLVGHSIGGAYMRLLATTHPEATAALILVDPSSPVGVDWSALGKPSRLWNTSMDYFAAVGGVRFLLTLGFFSKFWRDLPPEEGAAVKAVLSSPKRMEAAIKERSSLADTIKQISTLPNLGSLPLTVIYSEKVASVEITESQKRAWLNSSTSSRFMIVRGADHISVLTNKEHARKVANVIVNALGSLRR